MPAAAATATTLRMSRVRRAGKTFTSTSVMALPITAGITRNGRNTAAANSPNVHPPPYTQPYAVNTGIAMSATIQLEAIRVSSSCAPYRRSQSTGPDTSRSRSFARKKLESAVMTFESSRIEKKLTSISPSSFPESSGPISGIPRKYTSRLVQQAEDERPEERTRSPRAGDADAAPLRSLTERARAVSSLGTSRCSSDGRTAARPPARRRPASSPGGDSPPQASGLRLPASGFTHRAPRQDCAPRARR